MTCTSLEFLSAAEAIADKCQSANEAISRAVISRAYYACYHHALARAKANGFNAAAARHGAAGDPKMGVHALLISEMEKSDILELRQGASRLKKMRTHRVNADYELQTPLVVSCAQILKTAKDFMDL